MKRRLFSGGLVAAAVCGLTGLGFTSLSFAQSPSTTVVKGASVLASCPGDATLVVRIRDMASLTTKLKGSPLYKILEQKEFADSVAKLKAQLEEGRAAFRAETGVDIWELLSTVQGEAVLYVGGASQLVSVFQGMSTGNLTPAKAFETLPVFLAVDSGSEKEKLGGFLDTLRKLGREKGAKIEIADFHGGKITTVSNPEGADDDGPEHLYLAEHGTRLLFGTSKKLVEQTVVNLNGGGVASNILNDPLYRATLTKTDGGEGDVYAFINTKAVIESVGGLLPPGMGPAIWFNVKDVLFGKSLNNIGLSASILPDGLRQTAFVHNNGASDGIVGWFKGDKFSSTPEKMIPETAGTFSSVGFNATNFGKFVRAAVKMAMSFQAPGQDVDVDQMVQGMLGIRLEDLIRGFGSKIHMFGSAEGVSAENPLGDQSIVLELKDEGPLKQLIERANQMAGGALSPKQYLNRDIFEVSPGEDGPAFSVTDRKFVMSFAGGGVEKIIRRLGKDEKGLKDSAELKQLLTTVPAQVDMIAYSSSDYMAQSISGATSTLSELGSDEIPPELAEFLEAVGKKLGASIGYGLWGDQGLLYDAKVYYRN